MFKGTALLFFTSFEVPESTTRKIFCKSLLSIFQSQQILCILANGSAQIFLGLFLYWGEGNIGALGAHFLKGDSQRIITYILGFSWF